MLLEYRCTRGEPGPDVQVEFGCFRDLRQSPQADLLVVVALVARDLLLGHPESETDGLGTLIRRGR